MNLWILMATALAGGLMALAAGPASGDDVSDWYEFAPQEDFGPSVIGMEDWLEAPAGRRGGVRIVGDHFEFEDGTPVKFWGVNIGSGDCAPAREAGTRWAEAHAKYGVNCVRLHKFVGTGRSGIGDPQDSTKFDPDALDRLDHFCAELRRRGIYYGFSWIFGHKVRPADADRLIAYDEIVAAGGSTPRVPIFIAPDVQDLRIAMLSNLLSHRNPYTGLTYAEDPALAFVEMQNEDSIFFYTFSGFNELDVMPTYKRRFLARFSRWLRHRYGSHEALVEAWGERAMNAYEVKDEHLDRDNIMVQGNPWFFSPDGLKQAEGLGTRRRLLDTAAFLHEAQGDYYGRFAEAIRAAGYEGPLVGSCWHTPAGVPQYYNLHNDYEVGFIDRHAYFGRGTHAYRPQPGKFGNASQLDNPGSGILSTGLVQMADRPFAISEWTTVFPNEWVLESPAIVAAYGMGLQGWDGSYEFASHIGEYEGRVFASRTCDPRLWVVDLPNQLGLYPALARMVYRGDVQEGEVIGARRISLQQLREGGPDWLEREVTERAWDFKEYQGAFSRAGLAAGRVVVEFVDEPAESDLPDLSEHVEDGAVRSTTGQLTWHPAGQGRGGYFTVDTDATEALVGFLPDEPVRLGQVTIASANRFAGIFVTALQKDATIADGDALLLVAMARVRNTGMRYSEDGTELLALGQSPMLIEPVAAQIAIGRRTIRTVRVLDHDGRRTDRTLPVRDATFAIDGARDRAFYYEIELE